MSDRNITCQELCGELRKTFEKIKEDYAAAENDEGRALAMCKMDEVSVLAKGIGIILDREKGPAPVQPPAEF